MDDESQKMRMMAASDQAVEATRKLARQIATYRLELLKHGVSYEETKDLVQDYQSILLDSILSRGK